MTTHRYIETVNIAFGPQYTPIYRLTIDGVICGRGCCIDLEDEIRESPEKCEALYQAFVMMNRPLIGFRNLGWAHEYATRLCGRFACHVSTVPNKDGLYRIVIDSGEEGSK